ncbi:TonB-dependent receptor [Puteibacter caeruleilacunae]|nr:TonB-dependent receptor [Puteibacter caeruleilacunae]
MSLYTKYSLTVLFILIASVCANANSINDKSANRTTATNVVQGTAEQDGKKVTGKVVDEEGLALPGVTITVHGATKGVITDIDGNYEITGIKATDKLVFSFIGMESEIVDVDNKTKLNVTLKPKTEELEDVTVVAFAKQKKESVLASISTVDVGELKVPSSNLTTAMAGRIAGVISYQRSGEPGQDNAEFFVRGVTTFGYKKDPLILIDGVELTTTDLARLQTDDIASFSIMKDATATALYGARGANGVILVTTKEGKEGKAKVSVRFENSWSAPTQDVELADPITYMKLHNESVVTRSPFAFQPYTASKIENTIAGNDPVMYPMVNWQNMLFKDHTVNKRLNFNVNGGGKVARYYFGASVSQDNGILKVPSESNFNNNIDFKKYLLRSNINVNLTKSTEAIIRFQAGIDDYQGPLSGGADIYKMVMKTNPVLFPAYYRPDEMNLYKDRIFFGNYSEGEGDNLYLNPYAELVKGYKEISTSRLLSQFEVKQDLSGILNGLGARLMFNMNRSSSFTIKRSYEPFYYTIESYDKGTKEYTLLPLNKDEGRDYLGYSEDDKTITNVFYGEAAINYNADFNEIHGVSGLLVGTIREETIANPGSLEKSLPYRNLGISGRFTYNYDSRYFAEFNFGYNGSERFSEDSRFGFFPSVGAGYIISNEGWWRSSKINKLKLKATHGIVGNDAIGSADDRFYYLSNVNLDASGSTFGTELDYSRKGVEINRYENKDVSWEIAHKTNVGFELGIWDAIELQAEYFHEYRENILMERANIPAILGLEADVKANIGEAIGQGIDVSCDFNKSFNSGLWLSGRANFTYADSEYKAVEEPDYSETPWKSKIGQNLSQQYGYIAERLFFDDEDIDDSPVQTFGEYMPGDIKYVDVNRDGYITSLDKVPIGHPTSPKIVYGGGISAGWKNFDISFFIQGSAQSSFWIDVKSTSPFINLNEEDDGVPDGLTVNQALLKAYADDHWSENNRNPYALWPRLSYKRNQNNEQKSTWFMHDGAFVRLKNVEIGYSLPTPILKKIKFNKLRVYCSGSNLHTWSNFKLWDPENAGNGLGYPNQRVINLGIQIGL